MGSVTARAADGRGLTAPTEVWVVAIMSILSSQSREHVIAAVEEILRGSKQPRLIVPNGGGMLRNQ